MLKQIIWQDLSNAEQRKILQRPLTANSASREKVQQIIDRVRQEGDAALKALTLQFDKVALENLKVTEYEFAQAEKNITAEARSALQLAAKQIETFHRAQLPNAIKVTTAPGIYCEMQYRAIEKVGLYVPGGTARLPSAVLMLGIPAKLAGCHLRILCSPPRPDDSMDPHILFAAQLCGIENVYKIGGAQAIAAMAYGTATIPKVDKIFGPGNSWVTQAKILVAQDSSGANYDSPAGPTEQMVIADKNANSAFIAADLLSQAEHGVDSQVIFASDSEPMLQQVNKAIEQQLKTLPRKEIAQKALENSYGVLVPSISAAIEISNQYAPEHLILQVENPRQYIEKIQAAGSVFLGPWASESVGDYASGTNHVLPTYGYARSWSGLSLQAFLHSITFQELTPEGLNYIAPTVATLASLEELEGHRRAVMIRAEALKKLETRNLKLEKL